MERHKLLRRLQELAARHLSVAASALQQAEFDLGIASI
jgi:hypothetical protein